MMEALGLKPKSAPVVQQPMDPKELEAFLKKNKEEEQEAGGGGHEGIQGLGFQ